MVTVALLVRLEAKPGKEAEVESFLKGGLAIVHDEPADDGVVRDPDGPVDLRHLRRLPRRGRTAGAPYGPRRRGADGEGRRPPVEAAVDREGRRPRREASRVGGRRSAARDERVRRPRRGGRREPGGALHVGPGPDSRDARVVGEDLVLTECGMPCDTFNAVCRSRLAPAEASARIREAIAWFAGRPFSWWVGPADDARGPRCAAVRRGPFGRPNRRSRWRPTCPRLRPDRDLAGRSRHPSGRHAGRARRLRADQRGQLGTARSARRPLLRARRSRAARAREPAPDVRRVRGRGGGRDVRTDGRGRRRRPLRNLDARGASPSRLRVGP